MRSKLDIHDMLIMRELSKDSTQSVKVLSEKLNLHPNTLSQRIKTLEQNKYIKRYTLSFDPADLGFIVKAFVMIRVRKNLASAETLLSEVSKIPEVTNLASVTGSEDCVATVYARDTTDLVRVLRIIQTAKDVLKTTTFISLIDYKQNTELDLLEKAISASNSDSTEK